MVGLYGSDLDQYSLVTGDDAVVGGGTVKLDGFVVYDKAVKTYAAFSELEWRFVEPLSLTLGLRRNYERFKRRNVSDVTYQTAQGGLPIPDEAVEAINTVGTSPLVPTAITDELRATGFIPLPQDYDQSGDTAFRVWLPKAGLTWRYRAEQSVGLIYSEGYRSGGTSISFFGGEKNDYGPEFTNNFELAFRNRLTRALSSNLNVFYTKWRDQQVEIGNSTDYYTVIRNAGRSHLYGAELEGDWRVSKPLRLSASIGYLHTEFARTQKALVRGKRAYAPEGGAFDSLLTLSADRNDGQPDYNMESGEAGSDSAQRRRVQINDPSRDLSRSGTASLRNRYRINDRFALTAITAHLRTQQDYTRDYDGLAEEGGTNLVLAYGRNVSQELRLNIKDWGAFTGVVGFYGGVFKDDNTFFSNAVFADANFASGTTIPVAGELVGVELDFVTTSNREATNLAGFTEFDIRLPWQLTATLGLRYDTESLDALTNSATTRADARVRTPAGVNTIVPLAPEALELVPGINVLPVLLQAPGVLPNTNGAQRASTRYSALLPKLGLRWAFASQWSVFAGYTEGYRAGGVDVDTQTQEVLPYKPEYTRNFEIGLRGDLARFDVAANVFHTRWRDQQVPVLRGFFFVNQNAANSRLSGAELSLGWRVLPTLRTQASLGMVRTEFLEYVAAGQDFTGNQFIFAPRHTVSVGGVWRPKTVLPGFMAALNLSHRGKAFTSPANAADERSESRTLLDGRIGYERGFFRGYLFGKNLTDNDRVTETYQFRNGYAGAPTPRGYAAYTPPRTLGVQIEARF